MVDSKSMLLLMFAAGQLAGCRAEPMPEPAAESEPPCNEPAVRELVERFGSQLKGVSLLAPDTVTRREIREAYAPLVAPDLVDAWISDLTRAPGRQVSSPWPERIEIRSAQAIGSNECVVRGDVVYVTSAELPGEATWTEPVTVTVRRNAAWRISAYEAAAATPDESAARSENAESAVDVLRRYYAAISARDFARAYALWRDNGAASGQTLEEFADGFERTTGVELEVGAPGRVEGAAGSRYIQVPVTIRAVTVTGDSQRFEGTYTLRRNVVEGATAEQRQWRIASAAILERR